MMAKMITAIKPMMHAQLTAISVDSRTSLESPLTPMSRSINARMRQNVLTLRAIRTPLKIELISQNAKSAHFLLKRMDA